jgi:hypothetical protein
MNYQIRLSQRDARPRITSDESRVTSNELAGPLDGILGLTRSRIRSILWQGCAGTRSRETITIKMRGMMWVGFSDMGFQVHISVDSQ